MKKNSLTLFILLTFFAFFSSYAQKDKQKTIDDIFKSNKEVYFSFQIFDRSEISVLTKIISIDNVRGHEVYAYANKREFSHFLDLGYKYILLPSPGTLIPEAELDKNRGNLKKPANGIIWNFYPTYPQYVSYMQQFAANNPAICRLDTLGYTTDGRLLLAVKLSDSVNVSRGKPEFFIYFNNAW